jgi:two-component system response regulator YesN
MLKTMIVDDHYPVIEFLAERIPWNELDLRLIAACRDGVEALAQAELELPDILITDIGMPKMDGLQLIEALKLKQPHLQVVILSCHDEFHYAQKAVKLGVNDYVLKESLEPESLTELLRELAASLRERLDARQKATKLQHIVNQSTTLIKAEMISATLLHPMIDQRKWISEMAELGVALDLQPYLPVLVYPNDIAKLKERFKTKELFMYAFENVVNEVIDATASGISFRFSMKELFLLFPFPKSLKVNHHELVRDQLSQLLFSLDRYTGITASALIGEAAESAIGLKKSLMELLASSDQRFYAKKGSIYKLVRFETTREDIFSVYHSALEDLKRLIVEEKSDQIRIVVEEWMQYIRDRRFPVGSVASWLLKMLMDIEIKYSSLQHFTSKYSTELLHQQIMAFESLEELEVFLIAFIADKIALANQIKQQSQRSEIYEAKHYVEEHLGEKISMEEVALLLRINPSHFSRIFKAETGETFIEYVIRVKMEHAKHTLEHSDKSVDQIAGALGYDNTSYFIKLFKAFSGYSPKDYRLMR